MKQFILEGMTNNAKTGTETWISDFSNALYEEAKELYHSGFAIIRVDAQNIPEEMLGEVVEILDLCYPETLKEPHFVVSGLNSLIPMSALTVA